MEVVERNIGAKKEGHSDGDVNVWVPGSAVHVDSPTIMAGERGEGLGRSAAWAAWDGIYRPACHVEEPGGHVATRRDMPIGARETALEGTAGGMGGASRGSLLTMGFTLAKVQCLEGYPQALYSSLSKKTISLKSVLSSAVCWSWDEVLLTCRASQLS